jgi:uncharacterized protein (DUF2249 family)
MELIATYASKPLEAHVHKVSHNLFIVEYYNNGQLVNKTTHAAVETAKFIADNYTGTKSGSKTLLNENA